MIPLATVPVSRVRAARLLFTPFPTWINGGGFFFLNGIRKLRAMSDRAMSDRDLSVPLPGYKLLPRLMRVRRERGNRPLSDGDLWAVRLSPDPSAHRRSITDHNCLKVYHKDPAQAFSHAARPANGDARVSEPPRNTPSAL